jgi:glucuronoarabinoxylan endo-1,4-beta-xylanase
MRSHRTGLNRSGQAWLGLLLLAAAVDLEIVPHRFNGGSPLISHATGATPSAHWPLDEAGGTSAADATGQGHTATLASGASFTPGGRLNGAVSLDGVTGRWSAADAPLLEIGSGNFTVATWIKTTRTAPQIIAEKESTGVQTFFAAINRDNVAPGRFSVWTGQLWIDGAAANLADGQWHHVAVTFEATSNLFRLYVDGALDTETPGARFYEDNELPWNFGYWKTGERLAGASFAWPFAGLMDDVRIYRAQLSAAEISDLFNATPPPPTNQPPVVVAGTNQSILFGTPANLNGTVTDDGLPNGTLTTVWSQVTGPGTVTFANSNATATTAGFSAAGVYALRLTASDGALSAQDELTVTVTNAPVNTPPTVALTSPTNSAILTAPATVNLAATATDSNGTVVKVEFFSGTTKLGEAFGPFTFNWTNVPAGSYTLTARALDNGGLSATSAPVAITVNPGVVTEPGLNAYWPFNEGSGTNAADATGKNHPASLRNGTGWTSAGYAGAAVSFDGVDDFLQVADAADIEVAGQSFTIALWMKTTRTAPQMLVEKQHTSWNGEFLLALNRDNAVPGGFSVWTGSAWLDSVGRGLTDGAWHHLAVTYTNGTFRLYRDGVLDRTVSASAAYANSSLPWSFGRFIVGGIGWPFLGQMDEVRIYQRALSALEVDVVVNGAGNRRPVASNQTVTTPEDTPVAITLAGSDPENAPLTFAIVTPPAQGLLTGTPPNLTYRPNTNYFGPDSFTFTVNDGELTSPETTVSINVTPVNDLPVAFDQSITTPVGTPVAIALGASDVETTNLTFTIVTAPARGTLTGSGSNRVYTPTANYAGPDSFTFRVSDGAANSGTATVSLTVAPLNGAPIAAVSAPANNASVLEGTNVTLSANAADPGGSVVLLELFSGATKLGQAAATNLTLTLTNISPGTYSFTAVATDNEGLKGTSAPVALTVRTAAVYRAVNLFGNAVTIEGRPWRSYADALTRGLSVTNALTFSTTYTNPLVPTPDAATQEMLSRFLHSGNPGFGLAQTVPNGAYQVYLWMIEHFQDNARRIDVQLEGVTVATGLADLPLGHWRKYGPFRTVVNDGTLNLDIRQGTKGNPTLAGVLILSESGDLNEAPAVALTSPTHNSVFPSPLTLTLTATASDRDGSISKVEFLRDGVKIGERTSAPYSLAVSNLTPGSYVFAARATDNQGAAVTSVPATVTVAPPPSPVTVDASQTRQEIDGFGVSSVSSAMWIRGFPEPARSEILRVLYSITNGVGFSIVRNEIISGNQDTLLNDPIFHTGISGAQTLQPGMNTHEPSEGVFDWQGDESQIWLMRQAKNFGVQRFVSTVWSPPAWMKQNNSYRGDVQNGQPGRLRPDKYAAFASYLSRYIREYKSRHDLDIFAVAIANEPDYAAWYQGCIWTGEEMRDFIKDHLRPTFQADNVNALVIAPENSDWTLDRANEILADPAANAGVQIIGNHGYDFGAGYLAAAKAHNKRVWMTEVSDVIANDPSITDALRWAKFIHRHMTEAESNAWIWWWATYPGNIGQALIFQNYWSPDYLPERATYRYAKRLWAIGNFSRFVRPGFVRVTATANPGLGLFTSAFRDPASGQFVLVIINEADLAQSLPVTVANVPGLAELTPYVTSPTQDLEPQPNVTLTGGQFTAQLPPRSITTFVRHASPLPQPPLANAFLSDLEWISMNNGSPGPVEKDRLSAGEAFVPLPITLKGTNCAKGLGFTAPSTILYNLDGRCAAFRATIGVTKGAASTVRFEVWADGEKLFESPVMNESSPAQNLDLNVAGRRQLRLVASDTGNRHPDNQGVWANARVTFSGVTTVSLTQPADGSFFNAGDPVPLVATASNTVGTIARVEFYRGTNLIGTDLTSPFALTWSNAPVGTHTLTARAFDSQGGSARSAPVNITVRNAASTLGLAGHWPLDDGLGTNALDASGFAHHAALLNGPAWTPAGRIGGALSFDGNDDHLRVNDAATLEIAGRGYTVALWVRTTRAASQLLVEKQNTGFTGQFLFALNRDGANPGGFSVWTGNQWIDSLGKGLTDGQWHHLAVTYTNGVFALYKDGVLDRTRNATAAHVDSALPWTFGRFIVGNTGWPFAGLMDDLRIYQRALSATEVSALLGGTAVNQAPLVNAGPNLTITLPAAAALNGSVSDDGLPGSAVTLAWTQRSGPGTVTFSNSAAATTTAGFSAPGLYLLRLTADDGELSAFAETTVTVNPPVNQLPTVSLTSPANGASFAAGTNIALAATASDPDGSVTRVEFFQGAVKLGEATNAPFAFVWTGVAAGTYSLTARATDNQGGTGQSGAVTITVVAGGGAADLKGYWPMDDGTGTTAQDASGNNQPATLFNGPTWTAGRIGGAVSFDGVDDYCFINDSPGLELPGRSFTLALWVRTSRSGPQMLVEKRNSSFGGAFFFALNRDNAVPGGFSVWNGSQWIDSTARSVTNGQWRHLAVTYDRNAFRFYLDGALDRTVTAPESYVDSSLQWTFGRFLTGGIGWPFAGQMDDVRLYHRPLTASELSALASAAPGNQPPAVQITSPTNGAVFAANASIPLAASASDPDGTVARVEFFAGATKLGEATNAPWSLTWSNAPAGVYSLTATATDNGGAVANSAAVPITVGTVNPAIRILPLGDSITDGFSIPGGYRISLWQRFLTNGQNVDFVGLNSNGPDSLGDKNHQGHSGWRIDEIAAQVNGWLSTQQPQIILLLIGANDVDQNFQLATAPARLASLLDQITSNAPNAYLVVSTLTPFSDALRNSRALDLNAALPGIVHARVAQGRRVSLVDMYGALTTADLADGTHPTAEGYAKMAAVWHGAINQILAGTPAPVNNPPSVLLTNPPPGATFTAPASLTLGASALDAGGTIAKVEYFQNQTKIGEATAAPFTLMWPAVPAGNYQLTARATDNQGAATLSPPVNITVSPLVISDVKGHWPFEDGGGTNATDASGNGQHGALLNGVAWTASGRAGGAVSLDGVDDFMRVPDSTQLEIAGRSFTIALWVRTSRTSAQMLVEKQHTSWNGEFLLALNRDNAHPGGFSVWTGSQWIDSVGKGLTDGQWHHLAVTFEAGVFRIYRDGALDRTQSAAASYVDSSLPWTFGRFIVGNIGWPFLGLMDEVRIYHRALGTGEINGLFTNPGGAAPALAASLSFSGAGEVGANLGGEEDAGAYTLVSLPAHGLLAEFDPATGNFRYQPAHGFAGNDRFEIRRGNGPVTIVHLAVADPSDANGNGLPDDWEAKHGISDPDGDADQDGLSNRQEYLANTDPNDATSGLLVATVGRSAAGHLTLTWPSVGGTRYRVRFCDQLGGKTPFKEVLRSVREEMDPAPAGDASTQTFVDDFSLTGGPPAQGMRFYRIEVVR